MSRQWNYISRCRDRHVYSCFLKPLSDVDVCMVFLRQGVCAALTGVLKTCSEDGCKVLTGGMLTRTEGVPLPVQSFFQLYFAGPAGSIAMSIVSSALARPLARALLWVPALGLSLSLLLRWEDSNDGCDSLATLTCDQTYQGTPDLICHCAPVPPPPVIYIQNDDGLCLMAQELAASPPPCLPQDFNVSGAAVYLHSCWSSSQSTWLAMRAVFAFSLRRWRHDSSTGQLTNANETTRCLHAAQLDPGSLLVMMPCSSGPSQNLTLDEGTSQIRLSSGLCLEWRGDQVVTAVCGVAANQHLNVTRQVNEP